MKLKLPRQIEDFFQVYAKVINGKYVYFPNFYIKKGENEWEEVEFKDLPNGIKEFIKNKRKENNEI